VNHIACEAAPDLEAWEQVLRKAVLAAGAQFLEDLLRSRCTGHQSEPTRCTCGQTMRSQGIRTKKLITVLGPLTLSRSLYRCPDCGNSRFPADALLGVEHTSFSPGVRRWMARAGSRTSFVEAEEDLNAYTGIKLHRRDIERIAEQAGNRIELWQTEQDQQLLRDPPDERDSVDTIPILYVSFDGTAIPMRKEELAGRRGKGDDGKPKGREVKLGCIFTQTEINDEGFPVRTENSTTYVGAIESSTFFGNRIYAEALRRGLNHAQKTVAITDGAAYNRTIIQEHFPGAIRIIDLYHAREHLHELHKLLCPDDATRLEQWMQWLDAGRVRTLLDDAQTLLPRTGKRRKKALRQIGYFSKNEPAMQYAEFRAQGLFIGSGVIEAGCRTVVAKRLKQSGMFWSLAGANAIIASRCCQFSNRFEDFWESAAA